MTEQFKLMQADAIRPGMWVECYMLVDVPGGITEHGCSLGWCVVTEVLAPDGSSRLTLRCGEGIVSASRRTVLLVGCENA